MAVAVISRHLSRMVAATVPRNLKSTDTRSFPLHYRQYQRIAYVWKANIASKSRLLSTTADSQARIEATTVPVTFIYSDGEEVEVQAEVGKHFLDVAHDNDISLEGACGGELACATCHLIFEKAVYDKLPAKLEEEEDMLDLAYQLSETSRLGCQVTVTEDMAGIRIKIPEDGL